MKYSINKETGKEYSFNEREEIFKDLATKIYILGAVKQNDQYLHLRLKNGANTSNVKSILKQHFNIEYKSVYCNIGKSYKGQYLYGNMMFCKQEDIIRLCKYYLENNMDLDYKNHYDPLGERNTISKRIYQYGAVRYDLLAV